jgi:hypothetical protein
MSKPTSVNVETGGDYNRVPANERTFESRIKYDTNLLLSYLADGEGESAKSLAVEMVREYSPYNMNILKGLIEFPYKKVVEYIYNLGLDHTSRSQAGMRNHWHPTDWNEAFVKAIIAGDMITYNMMVKHVDIFKTDKYAHPILIAVDMGTVEMVGHIMTHMTEFEQPYLDAALMNAIRHTMTPTKCQTQWSDPVFCINMMKQIMRGNSETGLRITTRNQKYAAWYISYAIKLLGDNKENKKYIEFLLEQDYNMVIMWGDALFIDSKDLPKCFNLFADLVCLGMGKHMFKFLPSIILTENWLKCLYSHGLLMAALVIKQQWDLLDHLLFTNYIDVYEKWYAEQADKNVHIKTYITPLTAETATPENIKYHIKIYKLCAENDAEAIKRAAGNALVHQCMRVITVEEATKVVDSVLNGEAVYMDEADKLVKLMTIEMYLNVFMDRMKANATISSTPTLLQQIAKQQYGTIGDDGKHDVKMRFAEMYYYIIREHAVVQDDNPKRGLTPNGLQYVSCIHDAVNTFYNGLFYDELGGKIRVLNTLVKSGEFDKYKNDTIINLYTLLTAIRMFLLLVPDKHVGFKMDIIHKLYNNTVYYLLLEMYMIDDNKVPEKHIFGDLTITEPIHHMITEINGYGYLQMSITRRTNMELLKYVIEEGLTYETFVSKMFGWPF